MRSISSQVGNTQVYPDDVAAYRFGNILSGRQDQVPATILLDQSGIALVGLTGRQNLQQGPIYAFALSGSQRKSLGVVRRSTKRSPSCTIR